MHTRTAAAAALVLIVAVLRGAPSAAATIQVNAGGDLQAAIDAARPGDVIALQPGAVFAGNFVLPDKGATTGFITIRTAGSGAGLPAAGVRIGPSASGLLAVIQSSNTMSALTTAPSAHHWRLELLEFRANVRGYGDIIALGSGDTDQNTLAVVPHDFVLDRLLIRGDPSSGQKRGIGLNSASTTISNSFIADCKGVGFDTQAIGGWNGPGPYTITNNYLEAAGENFMIGGASPKISGMVPANITFTRNDVAKPLAWKGPILRTPASVSASASAGGGLAAGTYYYFVVAALPTAQDSWAWSAKSAEVSVAVGDNGVATITWAGDPTAKVYRVYRGTAPGAADRFFDSIATTFTDTGAVAPTGMDSGNWVAPTVWSVKNLFELKEAEHVLVDGNVFEHAWQESQTGYAILFTPRNQDDTSPWVHVRDVTFSNNTVRHAGAGVQLLGYDDVASTSSERTSGIRIVNNVFADLGSSDFPGPGRWLLVAHGPSDVRAEHNTVIQGGDIVYAYGGSAGAEETASNFVLVNNFVRYNAYGVIGDNHSPGNNTIAAYLPGSTIAGNVVACGTGSSSCAASSYPVGNSFLSESDWQAQFIDYAGADYRLQPGSRFVCGATDGTAVGADIGAITAAHGGTPPVAPSQPKGLRIVK